jgi:predicted nuclease of predicted toxin-antitoxin system
VAAANDHIVVTCDLDFAAILAATRRNRPSVLQIRSDILTPERIGPTVLIAIRQMRQRHSLAGYRSRTIANPAAAT